jgi:hypothetical protein
MIDSQRRANYTTNGPYLTAQPVPDTNLVAVLFHWHTDFGPCSECGLPAAYTTEEATVRWYCCVCAARAAAEGTTIVRLEEEGDEES